MHRTSTALVLLLLLLTGGLLAQTQGPKSEAKPPSDQGAGDPADFPRPAGLVRKSYNVSRGVQRDEETATYHGSASADALIDSYTTALAATGWTQQARSDSGSGKSRVTIIDWENPAKEAEVRFYANVAGGGADLWVRIFTYKTKAPGKAATAEASPVSAKASPTSGPAAPASPAKSPTPAAAAAESGPATNAPLVVVPDVAGKKPSEAESLLKQNKLEVVWRPEKLQRPSPNVMPTVAGEQSPAAGTRVAHGSKVTLTPLVWSVSVPRVQGGYTQAEQTLAQSHLRARRGHTQLSTRPGSSGQVAALDPAAGTVVRGDSTVVVILSAYNGPLPDVVGKSESEAEATLTGTAGGPVRRHFQVQKGTPNPTTDRHLAGTVAAQDPAAGTVIEDGATVTLTLWAMTGPVPNVVSQRYSAAEERLTGRNAPGGVVKFLVQRGPTVGSPNPNDDDKVAEQNPAAGTLATDGSTVTLTTWTRKLAVPNVVGKTAADAEGTLHATGSRPGLAKFQVRYGPAQSTTEARLNRTVAEQNPAAGTMAKDDSPVTLTLWALTGPVPNVVGSEYAAAESALSGGGGPGHHLQFVVKQGPPKISPSQNHHAGRVAEQDPAAGTPAQDGSTVTLTLWAAPYPVPDVLGRTYADAEAILSGSGARHLPKFLVQRGPDKLTTDSRLGGGVAAQSPAAGESAAEGATVTLTMGIWAQPVPNVVGLPLAQARAQLAQAGIIVKTGPARATSDGKQDGTVAEQSPAAGTLAPQYTTVTLTPYQAGQ